MITEIGIAQQRLFDDDASNAEQHLSSTGTFYPSEISQPGSFPTMQTFQYQPTIHPENNVSQLRLIPNAATYEATQLLPQVPPQGVTIPSNSTNIDPPQDNNRFSPSAQLTDNLGENIAKKPLHQAKPMQSASFSPHDTEPFSSDTSPRIDHSRNENTASGLMSPRKSPDSTHDELALPAITVQVPSVKKKRGRPKKQPMHDDDEEDELALDHDSDLSSVQKPVEKRRPGRPPKAAGLVPTDDSSGETTTSENPASKIVVLNVKSLPPFTDSDATESVDEKKLNKGPKKKKTKRTKAAEKNDPPGADDDVIWVDSKPLETTKPDQENPNPESAELRPPSPTEIHQLSENERKDEKTPSSASTEKPPPKKRGRKRKNAPTEDPVPQPAVENGTESNAVVPGTETSENTAEDTAGEASDLNAEKPKLDATNNDQENNDPVVHEKKAPATPHPEQPPQTPSASMQKSIGKQTPASSAGKVPYRVGLSKRARIAPLLKIVRK